MSESLGVRTGDSVGDAPRAPRTVEPEGWSSLVRRGSRCSPVRGLQAPSSGAGAAPGGSRFWALAGVDSEHEDDSVVGRCGGAVGAVGMRFHSVCASEGQRLCRFTTSLRPGWVGPEGHGLPHLAAVNAGG